MRYDRGLFTSSHLYAPPQHVVLSHAAGVASEGILPPLGGRSMHYSANELRRIPLPRRSCINLRELYQYALVVRAAWVPGGHGPVKPSQKRFSDDPSPHV